MPFLGLILLVVLAAALIDIIGTDDSRVRGLPKLAWVFVVIFLPLIGSLAWLAVGRPTADDLPRRSATAADFPEYERPGRFTPADPEADREFLAKIRARAEEQRRVAREQKREQERDD